MGSGSVPAGRLAADLATEATPVVDPAPFRYSRLVDGSNLNSPHDVTEAIAQGGRDNERDITPNAGNRCC